MNLIIIPQKRKKHDDHDHHIPCLKTFRQTFFNQNISTLLN